MDDPELEEIRQGLRSALEAIDRLIDRHQDQ